MTTDLTLSRLWSWSHSRDCHLKDITRALLDLFKQTDLWMTLSMWDCITSFNTSKTGNYARILFVDSCLTFSQTNWHSSLSPPPSVSGSPASGEPDRQQLVGWTNSHPELSQSALAPLKVAFSPRCSSPSSQMTALQRTPLSSSWSSQMTLQSIKDGDESAYRQEGELAVWCTLNNLELNTLKTVERSWTSGETPLHSSTHHHTALWLQWTHSGCWHHHLSGLKWDTQSTLLRKRPSRGCISFPAEEVQPATGAAETVLLSAIILYSSITVWFGSATKQTSEDYNGQPGVLRGLSCPLTRLQNLHTSRVKKRAKKVNLDPSHPAHSLLNCCPLAGATEHWAPKQPDTRRVSSPRPYPTGTTHNTPQYCTSVITPQTCICTEDTSHSQFCLCSFLFSVYFYFITIVIHNYCLFAASLLVCLLPIN